MAFVKFCLTTLFVYVVVSGQTTPASDMQTFTLTDHCDDTDELELGTLTGPVVLYIPANVEDSQLDVCKVKLKNIKPRHFSVSVWAVGTGAGVAGCPWIAITNNRDSTFKQRCVYSYLESTPFAATMCSEEAVVLSSWVSIEVKYGSDLQTQRDTQPSGVNMVLTPFHYLACPVQLTDDSCRNEHERCLFFGSQGECDDGGKGSYYDLMRAICHHVCGFCTPTEGLCNSYDDICLTDAAAGKCEKDPQFGSAVDHVCSSTCGMCWNATDLDSCCYNLDFEGKVEGMQFHLCDKYRCFSSDLVCDGIMNCADGSDEIGCDVIEMGKGGGNGDLGAECVMAMVVVVAVAAELDVLIH